MLKLVRPTYCITIAIVLTKFTYDRKSQPYPQMVLKYVIGTFEIT